MVLMKAYMDESASEHPYLACGWIAREQHWDPFSEAWKNALDSAPQIPYFKLNDALGLKGPFAGWSETERDNKMRLLAQVFPHNDTISGIGCYIDQHDFAKQKDKIRRKIFRDPYYFCMATTMVRSVTGKQQIIGVDKVDFILDHSDAAKRMRTLFYEYLKPLFPKLGECMTRDDKKEAPLQAADFIAGIHRQLYEPHFRRIAGVGALRGIYSGVFEITPDGLKDIIALPVFSGTGSKPYLARNLVSEKSV